MVAGERVERRLAAILAADVAGYSRLTSADEEETHVRLKEHLRVLIAPKITEYRGRVVKNTGDGMLAEFSSVVDAVRCAVEIQRGMAERNTNVPGEERIEFRIGVNLGDVIIDSGDIFGNGVNVAVRLEGIADPGGICVSERVKEYAQDQLNVLFEDAGEHQLKNIARPVRAYHVRFDRPVKTGAALAIPSKPSIAVLPFQNLGQDSEQEYFADGVVEEIITALSRFNELFVIARNSSFAYKGQAVDVKQVARDLGVRYVLEGSVRKFGNRLRIMAQLIDASSGTHLWAERFEGGLENIFELQDQVASTVAGTIGSKLQEAEIERVRRKPTESLDAYDYYLRGLAKVHRLGRKTIDEAVTLFSKAMELDPTFASPYALAAYCRARRLVLRHVADREGEAAEVEQLARRAARLGADDAMALSAAALALLVASHDFEVSIGLVERALMLNPNLRNAWIASGAVRLHNGEPELAIAHFEYAMRLSPFDPFIRTIWMEIAFAHLLAGRYDQSLSASEHGLQNTVPDLAVLAASSALAGRMDKARDAVARIRKLAPTLCISTLKVQIPLRRAEDFARFAEGLRMAGLPE
jgi:TolB-like protein/class 3 adenylate cyclase